MNGPMNGIVAYGAYLPYFRLDRKAIGEALGASAGKGTRAVASYDEDTTSMGVEAARAALRGAPRVAPPPIYFATADPAYLDKTNATAIHAALALDDSRDGLRHAGLDPLRRGRPPRRASTRAGPPWRCSPTSAPGCPAAGTSATAATRRWPSSSRRGDDGAPAARERRSRGGGDGGFLERWRVPGDAASRQWEERFGEHAYVPLAEAAITEALKQAGITAAGARAPRSWRGPHGRANKRAAAGRARSRAALGDDLTGTVGNTGTAHAGLLLADALDRAAGRRSHHGGLPGRRLRCDVWRATAALARAGARRRWPGRRRAAGRCPTPTFLTWRGFLKREPPRRPDPAAPGRAARRSGPRRGSSASPGAAARPAARATCRRSACASSATRWIA